MRKITRSWLLGAALSLVGLGAVVVFSSHWTGDPKMTTLRVAFPFNRPVSSYDPTEIQLAPEYVLLQNLLSTPVELDTKGQIVAGVASRFEWVGNELHLSIRDDLKTIDGISITADDVAFSLMRVLVRSSNTHGNIRDMLCGGKTIKKITDHCDGIRVSGSKVILTAESRRTFLLPMLAAVDFSVMPRSAIDPDSLAIKDYRNTSGVYYVDHDDGKGHITLRANPSHYRYSVKIPQSIELVPSDTSTTNSSLKDFESGKVDFITTIDATSPELVLDFAKQRKDVELFATMDIRTVVLTFTERGLAELSPAQRMKIGTVVRTAFRNSVSNIPAYKNTEQYIPILGEGSLLPDQIKKLEESFASASSETIPTNLQMAVVRLGHSDAIKQAMGKALPGSSITDLRTCPSFLPYANIKDMPHMFLSGPDTGFLEDIGLISYSFAAGFFGMPKTEQAKWMDRYTSIDDKAERIKTFRQLHFDALANPVMVPISVLPYVAIARKPWKIGLPSIYGDNPLWRVYQE